MRIERPRMQASLSSEKDSECLDRGWSPAAPAVDKDSGWRPQARSALDYKSTWQMQDMESLQEKSLQDVGEGLGMPEGCGLPPWNSHGDPPKNGTSGACSSYSAMTSTFRR